jgi:hypothetical protein
MSDPRTIPPDLLQRYPELVKGLTAYNNARAAARFNGIIRSGPQSITKILPQLQHAAAIKAEIPHPQPIIQDLPELKPAVVLKVCEDKPIEPVKIQPSEMRVYPLIILAAIRTKQDVAARTWFIARHCDPAGTGWVYKSKFADFLRSHNVGERTRRRWIAAALDAGLLFEEKENWYGTKPVYRIKGVKVGGKILGAKARGFPIIIPIRLLLKRSWHTYAWAGYLATRSPNPISQLKLAELTGLSPRVQQKYQKIAPVNKKKNYCQTDLDLSHLTGIKENGRPSAFVGYKHKIYFRLPDSIEVPESMAKRPLKKKSDAVKVKHNRGNPGTFSDTFGREKLEIIRLFHNDQKSANSAIRKLAKDDRLPWNKPQDLFIFRKGRQTHNVWALLSVA